MKTTKGYLLSYYELGMCAEEYVERPFLVVKTEESAQKEVSRLNQWIKETLETIPLIAANREDNDWETQWKAAEDFIFGFTYPYEAMKGCYHFDYVSSYNIEGQIKYEEILLEE